MREAFIGRLPRSRETSKATTPNEISATAATAAATTAHARQHASQSIWPHLSRARKGALDQCEVRDGRHDVALELGRV